MARRALVFRVVYQNEELKPPVSLLLLAVARHERMNSPPTLLQEEPQANFSGCSMPTEEEYCDTKR